MIWMVSQTFTRKTKVWSKSTLVVLLSGDISIPVAVPMEQTEIIVVS